MSDKAQPHKQGWFFPLLLAAVGGGGFFTAFNYYDNQYNCGQANWIIRSFYDEDRERPVIVAESTGIKKYHTVLVSNFGPDPVAVVVKGVWKDNKSWQRVLVIPKSATTVTGSEIGVELAYPESAYKLVAPDPKAKDDRIRYVTPPLENSRAIDATAACGRFELK
jgi:hypothetical protein